MLAVGPGQAGHPHGVLAVSARDAPRRFSSHTHQRACPRGWGFSRPLALFHHKSHNSLSCSERQPARSQPCFVGTTTRGSSSRKCNLVATIHLLWSFPRSREGRRQKTVQGRNVEKTFIHRRAKDRLPRKSFDQRVEEWWTQQTIPSPCDFFSVG